MRGRIRGYYEGKWIIRPDGAEACDVFCDESDLPQACKGLEIEFDLVADRGWFRAVNVKAETER